jgi:hypothetical protein
MTDPTRNEALLDPKSLETIVTEAVGHASVCWFDNGIFDEKQATGVVDDLLRDIRAWFAPAVLTTPAEADELPEYSVVRNVSRHDDGWVISTSVYEKRTEDGYEDDGHMVVWYQVDGDGVPIAAADMHFPLTVLARGV